MSIYDNIKVMAKEKGKTVTQIEKELGYARSSISKFDKNVPSVEKVQAIARTLGSTTSEILGEVSYHPVRTYSPELTELINVAKELDRSDIVMLTGMAKRLASRSIRRRRVTGVKWKMGSRP